MAASGAACATLAPSEGSAVGGLAGGAGLASGAQVARVAPALACWLAEGAAGIAGEASHGQRTGATWFRPTYGRAVTTHWHERPLARGPG